jgi:hypothetical protein
VWKRKTWDRSRDDLLFDMGKLSDVNSLQGHVAVNRWVGARELASRSLKSE